MRVLSLGATNAQVEMISTVHELYQAGFDSESMSESGVDEVRQGEYDCISDGVGTNSA